MVLGGNRTQYFDANVFKDILKECDIDKDGSVTFEEFHKCITQTMDGLG